MPPSARLAIAMTVYLQLIRAPEKTARTELITTATIQRIARMHYAYLTLIAEEVAAHLALSLLFFHVIFNILRNCALAEEL